MDGLEIVRGLIDRGYSPHQAAALAGHILQESGGNPAAVNSDEGANGLLQWRGDRWQGLQDFAKARGGAPTDPNIQLDFVSHELSGPEKRAGAGFLAAPDVASASAALKPYIRFGDDSAGTRLANANGLFTQLGGGTPVGALASGSPGFGASAAPLAAPAAAPYVAPPNPMSPEVAGVAGAGGSAAAPVGALAQGPSVAQGLGALGKQLQGGPVEFLPDQQLQAARPNIGQSQQIASALAKAYGFGG